MVMVEREEKVPECVMLRRAPVAFRCTRISFERAKRVRGTSAPDLAIFVLLSSVGQMRIECTLRAADTATLTMGSKVGNAAYGVALDFDIGTEHLSN